MKDSTVTTTKTAKRTLAPSNHPVFFWSEIVRPIIICIIAADKRITIINSLKDSFKNLINEEGGSSNILLIPKFSILCSKGPFIPSVSDEFNFCIIPLVPPNNSILSRRVVLLFKSV